MSAKEKTRGFLAEFRKFVARGNVMDLAVGVIIGGKMVREGTLDAVRGGQAVQRL